MTAMIRSRRVRSFIVGLGVLALLCASAVMASAGTGKVRVVGSKKYLDFCVSIRFNATPAQITEIKRGLTEGSAILLDATDGQFEFGNIYIVNDSGASDQAELWVHSTSGRAYATYGSYGVSGQHINMFYPSNFSKTPSQKGDAYTVAHEFVHHVWSIADEYSGPGAGGAGDCEAPPGSNTATFCLMDNYFTRGVNKGIGGATGAYSLNELCVRSNHDPDKDTHQESRHSKSCWETIAAYSALTGTLKSRGGTAPAALPVAAAPAATAPTYYDSSSGRRFVLIIDRSGSMGTVDGASGSPTRMTLAKQAANIFVDLVKLNESIGVVSFSNSVATNMGLTTVTAGSKATAKAAINGLSDSGSTAIGDALVAGRNLITGAASKVCCQTIVLFTDGENNSGVSELSVIPSLVAANITVISVAIGSGVSTANLSQIAGDTSGKFFQVANSSKLPALMAALSAEATGGGIMARQPGFISTGQTLDRTVLVDSATQELTVTLTTDVGNTVGMSLVSPTGAVYSATSAPYVEFLSSAGTRIGIIRRPTLTTGSWKVRVTGQVVKSNAYDVTISGVAPGVGLTATSNKAQYTFPEAAVVTATPHFGQAVIGASVRATVVTPLGTKIPIDLFDDGAASHGDTAPNDGVYSAKFGNYAAGPGTYQLDVVADSVAASTVFPGEGLFVGLAPANTGSVPLFRRETSLSIVAVGVSANDFDGDGLLDAWENRVGLDAGSAVGPAGATGDPDGDGVNNINEQRNGTDPMLSNVWSLSEGSTGFFSERLAISNPHTDSATFSVTFLREYDAPIVRNYSLYGQRRMTIDVNAIPGLSNAAVSAVVNTTAGGVVVERTLIWDTTRKYGGHTGKAVQAPKTKWYLAEGEARAFDTYILFANDNASPASVTATYLLESGAPVVRAYSVPAKKRLTVYANAIPGVTGKAFSTTIESSVPITVERAMYFGSTAGRLWEGGHESAAVDAPSTSWFVAEGRTGSLFDMYLLLANPGPTATVATVRYLLPGGAVVQRTYPLRATSRTTIWVDGEPGLADTDVSAQISAPLPIIVERAMYWPDPYPRWYEAHNSAGVTTTGVEWALAEGEHGGTAGFQTYVLLANPGNTDALVTLTILRTSSNPVTINKLVLANSRETVPSSEFGLSSGERFGVRINSDQPIVVERAMYWNAGGQFWSAGTNETAVRIR